MPSYDPPSILKEEGVEYGFIGKLQGLKYDCCSDITDRDSLEAKCGGKFEAHNRFAKVRRNRDRV